VNTLEELATLFPNCSIAQTGSRVFGDATEESDWDYVILVADIGPSTAHVLSRQGFVECHSSKHSDDTHLIVRRHTDNVNLILTNSPGMFDLWQECTQLSSELGLNKEQRKILFSLFIDEDN
jgi:hypothetical protein